jgi:DNA-binding LacI/PurR family transcriptional regulator
LSAPTPLTIALLTESLQDEYEGALLQGVLAVARRETVQVLCLAVGAIGHPNPERSAGNFALDLLGKHNVSGILAVSSVLGGAVGAEGLEESFQRYQGIPLCSVGVPLEGYPTVQVDNAAGAEAVVRHVLDEHDARHVAYIRGPAGSVEAAERMEAYERGAIRARCGITC